MWFVEFTHLWKLSGVISANEDRRKYPQKAALREKNQSKTLQQETEGLALAANSEANSTATRHRRLRHHRQRFSRFLRTILGQKAGSTPGLSAENIHEYRRQPETKRTPPLTNPQLRRSESAWVPADERLDKAT